ncbi:hypothetical protein EGM88_09690 [Aureibaculum marinum]|uniref:Lipoprotein n=1 Tax=Aureibaculum marinum TaxID=2487930 RepID=A0A3N4NM57_9FLAO|nr:hypothetical protein [Aureibaculum marinum]RPD96625.1 hypothetical protein EGM88_09690 [Aureibaculum marinum]
MKKSLNVINRIATIISFTLFILVLLFSCKEKHNEKTSNINKSSINSDVAIQVTMEGKTHSILQKNIVPTNVQFKSDTLQFLFYAEENPFQLNLNLTSTDIVDKGKAIYTIPEINTPRIKVDLNFFNGEREGKKMNRRIIFRKGTINIKELTKNKLEMTFEGEGGGMMDRKNSFPISGKVNVSY